jgi:hypothetical protein
MMAQARQQWSNPFFIEFFLLGAWLIWKQRNDLLSSITSVHLWQVGKEGFFRRLPFRLTVSCLTSS